MLFRSLLRNGSYVVFEGRISPTSDPNTRVYEFQYAAPGSANTYRYRDGRSDRDRESPYDVVAAASGNTSQINNREEAVRNVVVNKPKPIKFEGPLELKNYPIGTMFLRRDGAYVRMRKNYAVYNQEYPFKVGDQTYTPDGSYMRGTKNHDKDLLGPVEVPKFRDILFPPSEAMPVLRRLLGVGESKTDRKSTRLNSSHIPLSRMPSSA